MKKSAKAPHYPPSKALEKRTADLLTKSAEIPAFLQFGIEFGEQK
jgi:hypothetical protein